MLNDIVIPLTQWYRQNKRSLPWRDRHNAYYTWVSEIMLQQTRVEAVKPYFQRFIEELPDVEALAECPEEKLLKLWEGLGYYNRVRNMQLAAQTVMQEYLGVLPASYEALLSLKGIGSYTAGAIASIAYNIPVPAVDGNVLRVITRITENDGDILKQSVKHKIEEQLKELKDDTALPSNLPIGIKAALVQFMHALSENSAAGEARLKMGAVSAKASHQGENRDGQTASYLLELSDESDGTRKLMALAPAIESALQTGGILLVDELERELHPMLMNYIIAKFQSSTSNPNGAQIVFTTHNTELMNLELLRKDQLYFADKRDKDGTSELYSISEFSTRTTENIRKGYLVGKYGATPDIEIEEVE